MDNCEDLQSQAINKITTYLSSNRGQYGIDLTEDLRETMMVVDDDELLRLVSTDTADTQNSEISNIMYIGRQLQLSKDEL